MTVTHEFNIECGPCLLLEPASSPAATTSFLPRSFSSVSPPRWVQLHLLVCPGSASTHCSSPPPSKPPSDPASCFGPQVSRPLCHDPRQAAPPFLSFVGLWFQLPLGWLFHHPVFQPPRTTVWTRRPRWSCSELRPRPPRHPASL